MGSTKDASRQAEDTVVVTNVARRPLSIRVPGRGTVRLGPDESVTLPRSSVTAGELARLVVQRAGVVRAGAAPATAPEAPAGTAGRPPSGPPAAEPPLKAGATPEKQPAPPTSERK